MSTSFPSRTAALVILLALLVAPGHLSAQTWQPIGLSGVAVSALARSGTTLLASGPQSLYHSTDDGATWEKLIGIGGFSRIETGSNGLIVAAGTNAFALSTDGGGTWSTLRDIPLRDSLGVLWTHVVMPGTNEIYIGTTTDVLRSSDFGATWEPRNTGLPENTPHVGALAPTPDGGLVGGSQGILGGSVYMTAQGAPEWVRIFTKAQDQVGEPTAVLATPQRTVLAAISKRGIIRSTDEGATWTDAVLEIDGRETVRSMLVGEAALFTVTSIGRIVASLDDGITWQSAVWWGLPPGGAQSLLPLGPNRYLAGTSSGIYELRGSAGADDAGGAATMTVAPVPSHDGTLLIRRTPASAPARYAVFDRIGRVVREGALATGVSSVRIAGLSSGAYLVRVVEGAVATTRTAVVTR